MEKTLKSTLLGLGLILSLLVSACSNSNDNSPSRIENGVPYYDFESNSDAIEALERFKVTCDESSCPTNVGALLITMKKSIGTCTFSMVSDTIAMTNRHCIPDDIAHVGAKCQKRIKLIYNINSKKEVASCEEILSVPDEYKDNALIQRDYAFIRVDKKFNGSTFKVVNVGAQDMETLYTYTATPVKNWDNLGSRVAKKTCTATMNSMVLPSYNNNLSPMIALAGCEIIPGNSGSPLLNQSGSIIGIIQNTITASRGEYTAIATNYSKEDSDISDKIKNKIAQIKGGHATNAACIYEPELGLYPWSNSECVINTEKMNKSYESAIFKTLDLNFLLTSLNQDAELNSKNSPVLSYSIQSNLFQNFKDLNEGETYVSSTRKICLKGSKNNAPWLRQYIINSNENGISKYKKNIAVYGSINIYNHSIDIDNSLKLIIKTEKTVSNIIIKFDLHNLLESSDGSTIGTITYDQIKTENINLKFCE